MYFFFSNRDKDNAVISEQVTSNFEARIYHIQPIRMKTPVAFRIPLHWVYGLIPIFIEQAAVLLKLRLALCKLVIVHKVVARVGIHAERISLSA